MLAEDTFRCGRGAFDLAAVFDSLSGFWGRQPWALCCPSSLSLECGKRGDGVAIRLTNET